MVINIAVNLPLTDIEFVKKEVTINEVIRGKMIDYQTIQIGVKHKKTGTIYPYIFSSFIKEIYLYNISSKLNTLEPAARVVVQFLNFIIDKIKEDDELFADIKTVKDIKAVHAANFISFKTKQGVQRNTVLDYEIVLLRFYLWLKNKGISTEDLKIEWKPKKRKKQGREITEWIAVRPFKNYGAQYPTDITIKRTQEQLKDFGRESDVERRELTELFINLARDLVEDTAVDTGIALGLCLQFYGGLRKGEVVNLTRAEFNIEYRQSMEILIRDNRKLLFSRLKDTKKEYPKRLSYLSTELARQTVFDTDLVWEVYEDHLKKLNRLRKAGKLSVTEAIFVDNNGNPMSSKVYEKHFNKVKKAFLKHLSKFGDPMTYNEIDNKVWGTHIGRGVFTNFLISLGFDVVKVAIARGDRNLSTSYDYIDKTFTRQEIKKAISELKNVPSDNFGLINTNDVKRFYKRMR